MRKLLLLFAVAALPASAATDYACVSDCTAKGYMYQYCQERCSYNSSPQPSRIDYTCMTNCQAKGYMYQYCQALCSY